MPPTAILKLQLYTCTSKQPKNHPKAFDCSDEIGLDPKSQTLIPCVHGLNEMEKIEELVAMAAMKSMGVGERKRMMRELTGLAGIRPTAVAAFRRTAGYGLRVGTKPSRAVERIVVAALD